MWDFGVLGLGGFHKAFAGFIGVLKALIALAGFYACYEI